MGSIEKPPGYNNMRISSLVLIASSVFALASATPTNHAVIARHAEEAREFVAARAGGPAWKREAEAEAGRDPPEWRREAQTKPPGWRREAQNKPPGWKRAPEAEPSPPEW